MRTVEFKSTKENFRKESLGLKQCTLREFDNETDERRRLLDSFIAGEITNLQVIISNKDDTANEHIKHKVSDVSLWKGITYIISWRGAY
jgi:hypothetical protein